MMATKKALVSSFFCIKGLGNKSNIFDGQVRTDLAAIQQEETDQAYAEDWLQAQMLEYERVAGKGSCQLAEISAALFKKVQIKLVP
jgi:hypothetical protein